MKVIRHTLAAAALAAIASVAAVAQTAQRPASSPAPAQGGAIAEGRFAVIDTDQFTDQNQGIKRLVAAWQALDREFKPRRDEVQQLQTRYDALVKEISETQKVADQKAIAAKADQAEQLKTEIERKQQDGQKALEKRAQDLLGPVQQDISNAILAFARARGISVVFDLSKLGNVVMLVNEKDPINITDAFIADYNQRNPASTASTAPGRP
ncbi:MAG: OmpH family outer membrane protein [Acidobacteriota bacterium]|nr:OmpH family outer membrane protein [Acidobacteriota bacterium]